MSRTSCHCLRLPPSPSLVGLPEETLKPTPPVADLMRRLLLPCLALLLLGTPLALAGEAVGFVRTSAASQETSVTGSAVVVVGATYDLHLEGSSALRLVSRATVDGQSSGSAHGATWTIGGGPALATDRETAATTAVLAAGDHQVVVQ